MTTSNFKASACQRKQSTKRKENPQNWRIYLKNIWLIFKICKSLIQLNNIIYNNNNSILKMGKVPEQTSFQRRHANSQPGHEKIFNITNHQENANQNHERYKPSPIWLISSGDLIHSMVTAVNNTGLYVWKLQRE